MAKRRGSQNAGRPRKEGPRLPNGRLAPPGPNERVLAGRRELLGDDSLDVALASDPLDFAHAKGFLSAARYRAALDVAEAYQRAQLGGPTGGGGGVHEAEASQMAPAEGRFHPRPRNQWDGMSNREIARTFDAVFNVTGLEDADRQASEERAMRRWKAISAAMSMEERSEVIDVCVRRSWPQWVILMARDKDVPDAWDRKRRLLEAGLDKVPAALRNVRSADVPTVRLETSLGRQ